MHVNLKINVKDAMKDLNDIERRQFPYIYSRALTETAKEARAGVQKRTREAFDLHGEYIPRGILVRPAMRRNFNQGTVSSAVYTSDRITPFMAIHERGGYRKPRGRMLSVPATDLKKYAYRTSRGAVRRRWKPEQLLRQLTHRTASRGRQGGLRRKPFILKSSGSRRVMIARRVTRGGRGLEILYGFIKKARIQATWDFEKTVRMVAFQRFGTCFEQVWRETMARYEKV